ncbi:Gfo/Idh/MocA family protein [Sabulicella glaciei]|uniref:Gfo/Idh/MocA family oxidoreductase n=1 Tax=Sabulicella glaciei TaxID=2984948 RepID=A0ABT3NPQ7_9PROT|nr:Gfo/Idh/MocA family oxidoreductase [Roseococcus sp. MDT2-1-1]MCW8084146.1 Gfo/Idh/MocA family oxidoreductase [Roseococcus sp. MDT2-1-1]
MRRIRYAMVGGGHGAFIGAVHRMAARLDGRFELVAGALSSDPARAMESAAELGIRPYPDFAAMIAGERGRPDGAECVVIVTPNHAHHAPAKAALEAGLHVICDKPLALTVEEAEDLVAAVRRTGRVFVLTHNYSGYPLVRQARAMVKAGEIGAVRVVQVEYPQDWLATPLEDEGQKQAAWRVDPAQAGLGGSLGDLGTHAFHLAEFVTGLQVESVLADLQTFVAGRRLDDNAHLLLRFSGGARGMLWTSQVAPGNANALRLRIHGERASLDWSQEHPNQLLHAPLGGEAPRILGRGMTALHPAAVHASRLPAGHPEGYLEAFAQIYRDGADQILAHDEGHAPVSASFMTPRVEDGLRGMRFVAAAVASAQAGSAWMAV